MEFTDRVKLCEDGVYRWYYDLDMRRNPYMLKVTLKVLGIIAAVMMAMTLLMPSPGMSRGKIAGITLGCIAAAALLALGVYALMSLRRGGLYRYRYEMGPEGVRLLQEEGDLRRNRALGAAAAVAGTAAGKPGGAVVAAITARAAGEGGYTAYRSVRRVTLDRGRDCIFLRPLVGENCVYVRPEDFEFVKEYILSRLEEGAVVE